MGAPIDPILEYEPGDVVRIGGQDSDYVEVRVLASPSADGAEEGWLRCRVSIASACFQARFPADLRSDEFRPFRDDVRSLYESLEGVARFHATEEQLVLTLTGDGRGHVRLDGTARDKPGSANVLTFQLHLDQTQLFGTLAECDQLLHRFPA